MGGLALAVAAGALTVAAPCILPMLPLILGASVGRAGSARPAFIALGFVATFSGAALALAGLTQQTGLSADRLRDGACLALGAFALLMIWPRPWDWLAARLHGVVGRAQAAGARCGPGRLGGALLGMTLGLVWTPCAGPVLGSILTLVATAPGSARTALLLTGYAAGAALPMLAIAYGGQAVTARVRGLARHGRRLQQGFGVLMLATAAAMLLDYDSQAAAWLARFYPTITLGL